MEIAEAKNKEYQHIVAIVGGAVAGSEAASILADQGFLVVVFEQNDRPYGKIEDGLPRWHEKQRNKEYEKMNGEGKCSFCSTI